MSLKVGVLLLGFACDNNMTVAMCYFIWTEGSVTLGQPWERGTLAAG